jgi:hypothetical protein
MVCRGQGWQVAGETEAEGATEAMAAEFHERTEMVERW